jgi:hypothetical protein
MFLVSSTKLILFIFLLTKCTIIFTYSLWVSNLQPIKLAGDEGVKEISKTGQKMNASSDFKFRISYVLTPFLQFWILHILLIQVLGKETWKIVGTLVKKCFFPFSSNPKELYEISTIIILKGQLFHVFRLLFYTIIFWRYYSKAK